MSPLSGPGFQPTADTVSWKVHFRSAPSEVYRAVSTPLGRSRFWALSANQTDGVIQFVQSDQTECTGRILDDVKNELYSVEYFGWVVTFSLASTEGTPGTILTMTCTGLKEAERMEAAAFWVSTLLRMKASVDFGVDLRTLDPELTWQTGFAESC
ncbi:SRPBCC family protein [Kribbella deserti]|uniref:SRPBCC domain-containing protein n=1 Tax=Kribbella deserti TaxID=1926257 RepID=A0ABV6QRK6_9ACTN